MYVFIFYHFRHSRPPPRFIAAHSASQTQPIITLRDGDVVLASVLVHAVVIQIESHERLSSNPLPERQGGYEIRRVEETQRRL